MVYRSAKTTFQYLVNGRVDLPFIFPGSRSDIVLNPLTLVFAIDGKKEASCGKRLVNSAVRLSGIERRARRFISWLTSGFRNPPRCLKVR